MSSSETPSQGEPAGRLDSWKEIAAYLRRSVRSARRWEKEEGLPVHRHLHSKRDSVYAYKAELDVWWSTRGARVAERNGEEVASSPPGTDLRGVSAGIDSSEAAATARPVRRRLGLVGIGFAVAVLVVGGAAWLSRNGLRSKTSLEPLASPGRSWVLVANFENRTGEKLLDGTLDYALKRELSNSRQVSVVSRDRVNDALRLMRKPPDFPLDSALARDVCLRDGGIRALLTARVERLGTRYVLSVEVIEPKDGTALHGFTEESGTLEGSLGAVRRISDKIRSTLGETPATDNREAAGLAKVTTASLRALQLYSRADLMMSGRDDDEKQRAAEELLRQAVAEDPTFASAWILLSWTVFNQRRPLADYQPYLEAAMRLADTTTERERYFIRGSYYQMLGERDKAVAAYEALLDLYPDHPWALPNLEVLYDYPEDSRTLDRGARAEARFADARPNDFHANWVVAYDYLCYKHDPDRATPYLQRASALITPEVRDQFPMIVDWIDLIPFAEDWVKGDLAAAAGEIDRIAARLDSLRGTPRDYLAAQIALADMTLGRIIAATQMTEGIADPMVRNDLLAEIDYIKGDWRTLRRHLEYPGDRESHQFSRHSWDTRLNLEIRAGMLSEPEHYQSSDDFRPVQSYCLRGAIDVARGRVPAALREFEEAWRRSERLLHCPSEYLVRDALAEALAERGDMPRAIRILEADPEGFYAAMGGESAAFWLADRWELATLYRRIGRVKDAQAIEASLSKLLVLADPDHPLVLQLRRAQQS